MKLDYDLTILETQARDIFGSGPMEQGWCGPVLDAGVIDRHFDPDRKGRRTLTDLCCHYGIEIGQAHDAAADARASIEVLFALALRYEELWECDLSWLHHDAIEWHRTWTEGYDSWRLAEGRSRSTRATTCGRWPRWYCRRPEGDQVLSRSQTMSTPSSSARTTLAGCCLSMWPTRPL